MKKILIIFGTRPEAIKLAPVVLEMKKHPDIDARVCVTAQHRQMLDQVLGLFAIEPDLDLDLMAPGQSLAEVTSRVVLAIDQVLTGENPDAILVQGDTTTVMATAMAAFYRRVPVGHVEAGLRSGDVLSPFPEEVNRRIAGMVSRYHFAPTETAVKALQAEGVPENRIFMTGNTVIDALLTILKRPAPPEADRLIERARTAVPIGNLRLILVTAHRRENFGERFESLCRGLKRLVKEHQDVVIVYPVHLNPQVQEPVHRILGRQERVILTRPVEYDVLAHLMQAACLVLTDSGGIQEEAPSLGKPVLVMRTETERPEGVAAGTARLVGPFEDRIVNETRRLLCDKAAYEEMARAVNPYGDGHAAERVVDIVRRLM